MDPHFSPAGFAGVFCCLEPGMGKGRNRRLEESWLPARVHQVGEDEIE